MLQFFSKYKFFGIVMLVLSAIIITIIYNVYTINDDDQVLPIYQPNDVTASLVDTTVQHVKKYHKIILHDQKSIYVEIKSEKGTLKSFIKYIDPNEYSPFTGLL